ncbi:hypothetical protein MED222_06075 [Vibrio sp. MED222]|nr:hypothetical protein MED222_06075 [Vibrio sp. MED222]
MISGFARASFNRLSENMNHIFLNIQCLLLKF